MFLFCCLGIICYVCVPHTFSVVKAGWGDWAGPGLTGISQRTQLRRDSMLKAAQEEDEIKRKARKDNKMYNVMISERRIKTASKYKLVDVPHPYTTREEYERSIQLPLGGKLIRIYCRNVFSFNFFCEIGEWNATHVVKKNTMPEVLTRAGHIIAPIAAPRRVQPS